MLNNYDLLNNNHQRSYFMQNIYQRRSIRKYSDKPVTIDQLELIVKAGMNAPSAGNQQAWCFIVINQRLLLNKINEIHPHAKMLLTAPAAILVCGNLEQEKHKGYWVQDCSASTQNMLLAATELALGSIWLGVYPRQDRVVGLQKMFELPEQIIPFSIVATGYAGEETVTFVPFLVSVLIVFAVGVLMIWAKDPARRRHAEEHAVE